uniref:RBR-type E3 ubiquitin transferase n=1 Tax=Ditylenchus dipsaci TaxID=166011 RepID=A0A915DJL1_9BILA
MTRGTALDWQTQVKCSTEEQRRELMMQHGFRWQKRPGKKWNTEEFVCKFSNHDHPGVYSCPAMMRIRTKIDLSEALIQTARAHNNHRPLKRDGLSLQMKEQIANHKDKTASQIHRDIQKEQSKQDSKLRGLKTPTEKQITKQKAILAEKEDNKAIPVIEDAPYCIGFGKREVPKKHGEPNYSEWQFFLIFTTRRLMNKQHRSNIVQTDATYKLNLLGYPVLVAGFSDANKRFHPTVIGICSSESKFAYEGLFNAIKYADLQNLYAAEANKERKDATGRKSFDSETMAATHSNDVSEDVETDDVPAQQIVLVDSVTKASSYAIISEAEINGEMSRIVQEVHEVLGKIYASSILNTAIMFYKWDKDFFTEKFFEGGDPAGFFLALQLPATGLSCKSVKEGVNECGICSEDKSLTGFQCGHFFCGECWSQYLSKVVLGGNFLILCPEFKCKSLLDNDSVFSLAGSSEVSAKYKKLLIKSFVQHKKQIAACPADGCNRFSKLSSEQWTAISCACGLKYCFQCQQPWHYPLDCTRIRQWLKKCSDDSETANYIMANTKECPKCKGIIEKNGGCNHMTCKNLNCCNEFCWICLGPWSEHGSGYYSCNRFNDEQSTKARTSQEQSRAELARYLHYYNRFANHRLSLSLENKLVAEVNLKIVHMQSQGVTWTDAQYLLKAVDVLRECRMIMMYSYAFAYYLQKNNSSEIFEANQNNLEMATEKLSHLLENKLDNVDLTKLKQEIQDCYRYVDSRKISMLGHCKEGYQKNEWAFAEDVPADSHAKEST